MRAALGCLTLLTTFGFVQQARTLEVQGWKLIFFTLVFLLCASQLVVALMNWLSTLLVKTPPAPAPGLFLRHRFGLPHDGGRSHHAHELGGR